MPEAIRVLLADDYAMFRDVLNSTLELEDDIEVVGEAADGVEAVEKCLKLTPDVILLDIEMPRMNGVEATRQLADRCPGTRVVIVTAYEDDHLIMQLIQAGATGYLLKETDVDEVVRAIRVAHSGDSLIQPRVAKKMMRMMAQMTAAPAAAQKSQQDEVKEKLSRLTSRELEVLIEVGKGKNNKELGAHFVISEPTVKTHVARLMQKLEVRDRIALVMFAAEAKLL